MSSDPRLNPQAGDRIKAPGDEFFLVVMGNDRKKVRYTVPGDPLSVEPIGRIPIVASMSLAQWRRIMKSAEVPA